MLESFIQISGMGKHTFFRIFGYSKNQLISASHQPRFLWYMVWDHVGRVVDFVNKPPVNSCVFFLIFQNPKTASSSYFGEKIKNQRIANSSYFLKIKETTYFFMKEPIKRTPVIYMVIWLFQMFWEPWLYIYIYIYMTDVLSFLRTAVVKPRTTLITFGGPFLILCQALNNGIWLM